MDYPIREIKIRSLMPAINSSKIEASGVYYNNGNYYIIFDNLHKIAIIKQDFSIINSNQWLGKERAKRKSGFEGITYNPLTNKYLVVQESEKFQNKIIPVIHEFTHDFETSDSYDIDFLLKNENKGAEGITFFKIKNESYILLLFEKPNTLNQSTNEVGNILVLKKKNGYYEKFAYLSLPKNVNFDDFSDIAWNGSKIAVLSQESSSLWVGELTEELTWKNAGNTYYFPKREGEYLYCNLEGISWINETTIVLVSDTSKKKQPSICKEKSEMIHLWKIK